VAVVTLNRPSVRNALTLSGVQDLQATLKGFAVDPSVRAVVITGAGGSFCSGADLAGRVESLGDADRDAAIMEAVSALITTLITSRLPIVAAVEGGATGMGASIAFACDLVVASDEAYFLLPFTGIGLIPDAAATATVTASIGRAAALRMVLRRERLAAPRALDAGLIAAICAPSEVQETARAWATELAAGSAVAIAAAKRLINDQSLGAVEDVLAAESDQQRRLLAGADFREGVLAFVERRTPVFAAPPSRSSSGD
jgi:enoyl-CoA hydratase